jgi:ubiquinone/menaquinone biosynthesis C-methylase UbiE
MTGHFDWLAMIYDRFMHPPRVAHWPAMLGLPVDGWVLDVGGGTGRASLPLRPWAKRLLISDLSRPMLRRAHDKGHPHLLQASVEDLPFADESIARIMTVDALHHFPNQPRAIAEMLRVLEPGGRMVIAEPDIRSCRIKLIALAEKLALMGSHIHPALEIRDMVTAQGSSARIEYCDDHMVCIVVDK